LSNDAVRCQDVDVSSREAVTARSYGGRTADQRIADRRAALLRATTDLMAAEGEARATMTAICAKAGLTERYFYESFSSRDEAMLAALDAVCDEIVASTVRAIAETDGAPEQRVHAAVAAFVDIVVEHPAKGRVVVLESNANESLRARRHELLDDFATLVATEARRVYGEETWPEPRGHLHGLMFIAGLSELVSAWLTGAVVMTADELTEVASDSCAALTRRR
jgi:AcrR family transcriptional regulator